MAVTVARVHLAVAHAALPALLPTPPRSKMLPLLPTPACVVVATLPAVSPPKISHADSDERWDAHKTKPATAPTPPLAKPGRADSDERWDARKTKPGISLAPYAGGKTSPPDGKKTTTAAAFSSSSSSSSSTRASATSQRWDSNKRAIGRVSSAARWDAHKKPRPLQAAGVEDDDGASSTASNDGGGAMELDQPPQRAALYAGPGFLAVSPPEPSMLPMPAFMICAR
ncbi:hypothetical protein ACP4OV_003213 [Aristida adscensionis]